MMFYRFSQGIISISNEFQTPSLLINYIDMKTKFKWNPNYFDIEVDKLQIESIAGESINKPL